MKRGRYRFNRYIRRLRRDSKRAAGDHRRWWPSPRRCAVCKRRYVRLYRSYGTFLRDEDIACNAHVPGDGAWWVPLVESAGGDVWGYTSCPRADVARWAALGDAEPCAKRWVGNDWEPGL